MLYMVIDSVVRSCAVPYSKIIERVIPYVLNDPTFGLKTRLIDQKLVFNNKFYLFYEFSKQIN